jgi:hypothetical protein
MLLLPPPIPTSGGSLSVGRPGAVARGPSTGSAPALPSSFVGPIARLLLGTMVTRFPLAAMPSRIALLLEQGGSASSARARWTPWCHCSGVMSSRNSRF